MIIMIITMLNPRHTKLATPVRLRLDPGRSEDAKDAAGSSRSRTEDAEKCRKMTCLRPQYDCFELHKTVALQSQTSASWT